MPVVMDEIVGRERELQAVAAFLAATDALPLRVPDPMLLTINVRLDVLPTVTSP